MDRACPPEERLAPARRAAHLALLRARGPRTLAPFLERTVAATDSEAARLAALECLGGCASRDELRSLVRLAAPGQRVPSDALCDALRAAVALTLGRDGRAFAELEAAWRSAPNALREELIAAVGERGDPAGLDFLSWVIFEERGFERAVARACVPLAPHAREPGARAALARLCTLLDSADAACVQSASAALARARVEAAVPRWIELLEHASRGIRERARRSLEEVTGLALGPTRARWEAWHVAECAWLEEKAPALLAELESEDEALVLAAVRALAGRRFHRDELAQAVEPLLLHPAADVRLYACRALEALGSPCAVLPLLGALSDEEEAVARAAASALRALTGLDLALDLAPDEARARIAGR
jgi:hypothetical protein